MRCRGMKTDLNDTSCYPGLGRNHTLTNNFFSRFLFLSSFSFSVDAFEVTEAIRFP